MLYQAKLCRAYGTSPAGQIPAAPSSLPHALLGYATAQLAEKTLSSRSVLEADCKQVIVLFANCNPENKQTLLDPVLEHPMMVVHRHEGIGNQVMGDGILGQ
jgi:hypothetical protein